MFYNPNTGGRNQQWGFSSVDILNVNNLGTGWLKGTGLHYRYNHNAHVINGQIYIVGGRHNAAFLNIYSFVFQDNFTFALYAQLTIPGGLETFTSIVWNV